VLYGLGSSLLRIRENIRTRTLCSIGGTQGQNTLCSTGRTGHTWNRTGEGSNRHPADGWRMPGSDSSCGGSRRLRHCLLERETDRAVDRYVAQVWSSLQKADRHHGGRRAFFTTRPRPPLALSVGPRVRPAPASATSAAPSRSASSSEPRGSLAGRDIRPRETEYRAIPKAGTEVRHTTERAAPTIFRSQGTAYAPNIYRPNRAVRRCRRLPPSW